MNVIGDVERLFATSLYPLRVPIAIGLVISIVTVALVARRLGWLAAVRRHPRRSGTALAIVLAVSTPVAWYLASPLFIRTELIEPAPVAVADAGVAPPPTSTSAPSAASGDGAPSAASGDAATQAPGLSEASIAATNQPGPFVTSVVASGTFNGADDFHFGDGSASIIETAPGRFTLRLEAFSVRNGPDLHVYLSPDPAGYADAVLEVGSLKATDGSFGYELPDGTDPTRFASALIWCKQFSVLFAVARFEIV